MAHGRAQDPLALIAAVPGLDPGTYQRSPLHGDTCLWPEKNCYVDVWLEVLHALRLEPLAVVPSVLATRFEDDQWTFYKPSHEDLYELYGLDVQELNVWQPLLAHARRYLAAGKLIATEVDAWWLPDVAGTDYRRNHVKTTIILNALDVDAQTLDYFHNSSYHRLDGEDFRQIFRVGAAPDPTLLPLFAEYIRTENLRRLPTPELARHSLALVRRYMARRPAHNPVAAFGAHVEAQLPELQARGLDHYHLWAFGGIRQLGAGFELAAENLAWLGRSGVLHAEPAAESFRLISATCKAFVLKGARAVMTRKPSDLPALCATMAEAWQRGMQQLADALERGG